MAAETEELILQINVQKAVDSLVTLNKELQDLKQTRAELIEKEQKGIELSKEEKRQIEILNVSIKQQSEEYKAQQRILDGYEAAKKRDVDSTNFQNNSIKANRELLRTLTQQYIELRNPSQQATETIRRLTDVLKQQESAVGDNRRNVGNYKESILEAVGGLNVFGKSVSSVIDPLKGMKLGFDAAGGGVKGFGVALAATGLPLFITAFTSLVGLFAQFKPIADAVEAAVAGISDGFNALISGGNVIEATKQAYELTRQLQDLEDSQNGVKIATSSYDAEISRLLVSLRNKNLTYKEGQKIIEDLKNAENKRFEAEKQQTEAELANARARFLNKTGLYSAELDALLERGKVEKQLSEEEIQNLMRSGNLSRERVLELVKSEQAQQSALAESAEKKAKIDDDLLKKITELTIRRNQLIGESSLLREKIKNREDDFENKFAEREKKRLEDEKKRLDDRNKALEELAAKNAEREKIFIEATLEGEAKRLALFELEWEKKREVLIMSGIGDVKITKLYEEEKTVILQDEANKRAAILAKLRKEDEDARKEIRDNAVKQIELQRVFNKTVEQIDAEFAASSFKTFAEFYENKKKLYEQDVANKAKAAEASKKIEEAQFSAAQGIQKSFSALSNLVGEQTAAGIAFQKIAAGIQIAIDTAKAISTAIAGATAAASAGGPAAPFLLIGYVASMIGTVVGAVAQATQLLSSAGDVTPPKFAFGGDASMKVVHVGGDSHADGGTQYYGEDGNRFEVERNEKIFVMKADAAENISILSRWNQFWGGNPWSGPTVKHAAQGGAIGDGGFVIRELTRNSGGNQQTDLLNLVKNLPAPSVSVVEINKVNTSRSKSIAVSEL